MPESFLSNERILRSRPPKGQASFCIYSSQAGILGLVGVRGSVAIRVLESRAAGFRVSYLSASPLYLPLWVDFPWGPFSAPFPLHCSSLSYLAKAPGPSPAQLSSPAFIPGFLPIFSWRLLQTPMQAHKPAVL